MGNISAPHPKNVLTWNPCPAAVLTEFYLRRSTAGAPDDSGSAAGRVWGSFDLLHSGSCIPFFASDMEYRLDTLFCKPWRPGDFYPVNGSGGTLESA